MHTVWGKELSAFLNHFLTLSNNLTLDSEMKQNESLTKDTGKMSCKSCVRQEHSGKVPHFSVNDAKGKVNSRCWKAILETNFFNLPSSIIF